MRVFLEYFSASKAHHLERILHDVTRRALFPRQIEASNDLIEGVPDLVKGVVYLIRVLKDCLDFLPVLKTPVFVESRYIAPAIKNLSGRQRGEAEDRVGESGLPAPAFARNGRNGGSVLGDDQVEISQRGNFPAAL